MSTVGHVFKLAGIVGSVNRYPGNYMGKGMSEGSKATQYTGESKTASVALTLTLPRDKAIQLAAVKERSRKVAAFLSANWQELEAFLQDWDG